MTAKGFKHVAGHALLYFEHKERICVRLIGSPHVSEIASTVV